MHKESAGKYIYIYKDIYIFFRLCFLIISFSNFVCVASAQCTHTQSAIEQDDKSRSSIQAFSFGSKSIVPVLLIAFL